MNKNFPWLIVTVLVVIVAWMLTRMSSVEEGPSDDMNFMYSRLNADFPVGGKVKVAEVKSNTAGIITKRKIRKGEVIMKIEPMDVLPSKKIKEESWYPTLVETLSTARSLQLSNFSSYELPTVQDMLTAAVLLMERYKGGMSHWHTYIEALPRNVSHMSFYWSAQELKCIVPRMDGASKPEILQSKLQNFHTMFDPIWEKVAHSMDLPSPLLRNETEWAFLTIKTRAFRGELIPIFDMLPHDPTKSVTIFTIAGASYLVATRNHKAGEQVFISFNEMTPSDMAETYGFVDPNAAFVNAPSISRDLQASENTRDIDLCTKNEMLFFGNVPEGRVEAKLGELEQSTYFKPFHPTELLYQCVRVLVQSEDGTTIAKYISEKLVEDISSYETMANVAHCQSDSGNYPIIRQVNAVTARLLRGALGVAQKAARGQIEYPNIEYP